MVQTKRLEFVLDAPWEVAVLAYEEKFFNVPYPDNPRLVSVQFLEFNVEPRGGGGGGGDSSEEAKAGEGTKGDDADGATVVTFKRAGTLTLGLPSWMVRLGGKDDMVFTSETVVDRRRRKLHCVGMNETFRTSIKLDETTTFTPHPDDPDNKTLLVLEARMELLVSLLGMAGSLERWIIQKYETMITATRDAEREKLPAFYKAITKDGSVTAVPLTISERIARGRITRKQLAPLLGSGVTVNMDTLAADDTADTAAAAATASGAGAGAGAGAATGSS